MTTDTTEKGFENLIVSALTGLPLGAGLGSDDHTAYPPAAYGGVGYTLGFPRDYDREYAVDLHHLGEFLAATQPEVLEALDLENDGPTRRNVLARLQGEVTKRGVIDVLRNGIKHGPHSVELFYGTPSPDNPVAVKRNIERFPKDFMFQLSKDQFEILKSQSVTSSWGGRRTPPYAFTEQGIAMLSSVLRSSRAVGVNIEIMRTFVQLRRMLATHEELARKLAKLEQKYDDQFKAVFDAIRQLMTSQKSKKHIISFEAEREVTR